MLRLQCIAQQYSWGKLGAESAVARLQSRGEGVQVAADKPYAEYWFGTHPSGPSKAVTAEGNVFLQDWLLSHPEALGTSPYNAESALPYLLKILSVAQALSVQAHPDRTLAVKLHAARPDVYKDANHKPEMACALTRFEAMCSFRSASEIVAHLKEVPELRAMVGEKLAKEVEDAAAAAGASSFAPALRAAYTAMMSQPDSMVREQTEALEKRLSASFSSAASSASSPLLPFTPDGVALRLNRAFPSDVGVFSPYLLNLVALEPGQAIFLGANEPHAYLDGDCVEVMACSDNVVRAGLTPKFKDVSTLCEMLTYSTGPPNVLSGVSLDAHTRQYPAPVPEFILQRTSLDAAASLPYTLPAIPSAAIIVVVGGEAQASSTTVSSSEAASASPAFTLSEGQVYLQPANTTLAITGVSADVPFVLFRSHANPDVAAA